jgi:hypothetical protein
MAPLWTHSSASGMDLVAATADGGVTINDFQQGLLPLDANGNVPQNTGGQITILASYSWSGDLFAVPSGSSSLAYLAGNAVDWAHSFWAEPGGSPSSVNASAEMPWFPPLPSCPGASKPCAGEATWNAFKSLNTLMAAPCSLCDDYVFNKPGTNQKGPQFSAFLNRPPLLSDGSRSKAPMNRVMCTWVQNYLTFSCPFGSESVSDFMSRKDASAVSRTPSLPNQGPVIFINPVSVCTGGTPAGNVLNESLLFHESLHGLTGLSDIDLANTLGVTTQDYNSFGSASITYYLESNVLGGSLHYTNPVSGPLTCQN